MGKNQNKDPWKRYLSNKSCKYPGTDEIIARIHEYKGIIADVARSYEVIPNTVHNWIDKEKELSEGRLDAAVKLARKQTSDFARGKLVELIDGVFVLDERGKVYKRPPHFGAIAFYLKTQDSENWQEKTPETGTSTEVVDALTQAINNATKAYGNPQQVDPDDPT